jgi:hypothetical protein
LAPVNGVDAPGNRFALETLRDGFLLESVVIIATEEPPLSENGREQTLSLKIFRHLPLNSTVREPQFFRS